VSEPSRPEPAHGPEDQDLRAPGMPVNLARLDRHPQLLVDITDRGLGIGWQNDRAEGPRFVIVRFSNFSGVKVVTRFPLTAGGWDAAWSDLVKRDPRSAREILQELAERSARQAAQRVKEPIAPRPDTPSVGMQAVAPDQRADETPAEYYARKTASATQLIAAVVVLAAIAGLILGIIIAVQLAHLNLSVG
jgi:hypothetical protein